MNSFGYKDQNFMAFDDDSTSTANLHDSLPQWNTPPFIAYESQLRINDDTPLHRPSSAADQWGGHRAPDTQQQQRFSAVSQLPNARIGPPNPLHHHASEPQLFRRAYAPDPTLQVVQGLSNNDTFFTSSEMIRASSSHSTASTDSTASYVSASADYPSYMTPFESPFGHHPDDVPYTSEPFNLSADPLSLHDPNNEGDSPESFGSGSDYGSDFRVKSDDGSPSYVPTQPQSGANIVPSQAHLYRRPSSSSSASSSAAHDSGNGAPVMYTDDAASKESQFLRRRCFNCHTKEPPSWRRSTLNPGKIVCNKCGLYERTHLRPRPPRFDELRAGTNPKARKGSITKHHHHSSNGGVPSSPNNKSIRGIKREDPPVLSRRGSVSSLRSASSDWDENAAPSQTIMYGGGSSNGSYGSPSSDFAFSIHQQQLLQHVSSSPHMLPHPHPPHTASLDSSPIRIPSLNSPYTSTYGLGNGNGNGNGSGSGLGTPAASLLHDRKKSATSPPGGGSPFGFNPLTAVGPFGLEQEYSLRRGSSFDTAPSTPGSVHSNPSFNMSQQQQPQQQQQQQQQQSYIPNHEDVLGRGRGMFDAPSSLSSSPSPSFSAASLGHHGPSSIQVPSWLDHHQFMPDRTGGGIETAMTD